MPTTLLGPCLALTMSFRRQPSQASTRSTPVLDDRWVEQCLADATSRHGALAVRREDFVAAVQRVGGAVAHGVDFVLAIACEGDSPVAWSALVRGHETPLRNLLRGQGVLGPEADDLLADLWGDLAMPPAGGAARTRIGLYRGEASLLGWLGVILLRHHYDRLRAKANARCDARVAPDLDALPATGGETDPRRRAEESDEATCLRRALVRAFERMSPRHALALAFRYGDGVDLRAIGRQLAVGVPRVSRMLQHGLDELRLAVSTELAAAGADARAASSQECLRELTDHLANLSRAGRPEHVRPP